MSQEVELLKAMRLRDFGELQTRKTALAESYEEQSAEFRKIPGFAATLEPRLREELKDAVSRMHEVMKVNETAIKAARTVNEKLARVILDAVHEQRNSAQGYSNGGSQQTAKSRHACLGTDRPASLGPADANRTTSSRTRSRCLSASHC